MTLSSCGSIELPPRSPRSPRRDNYRETRKNRMSSDAEEHAAIRSIVSQSFELHLTVHGLDATMDAAASLRRLYAERENAPELQKKARVLPAPTRWSDLVDED